MAGIIWRYEPDRDIVESRHKEEIGGYKADRGAGGAGRSSLVLSHLEQALG
jgi:hypothetical protein